ncbi:sigma-70 family RNA polymerase sigma factor [Bacillus infantis]|uniref:sigma-70 family RNA polymerase sigma factor n=1 Tax=Bacillus infantis TaxID=324767 RepID=UPI003CFB935D
MEKQERDQLLTEAMDEYGHYLTRLAYAFVKDEAKAEDIIQEVYIRYYLKLEQFEGRSSVKTYLYRMTVNECKNYLKSWSFRKIDFFTRKNAVPASNRTPEEEVLRREGENWTFRLIDRLPVKYKEVLWLHYYAELSVMEIGAILKCPANTVKTRLARGRKMARLTMGEEEIEDAKEY